MNLPQWELASEYKSIESDLFKQDLESAVQHLASLSGFKLNQNGDESISAIGAAFSSFLMASVLLSNLQTYTACMLAVNVGDIKARITASELEEISSKLMQAYAPLNHLLLNCGQAKFEELIKLPQFRGSEFTLTEDRKRRELLLSSSEEAMIQALSVSGHRAWGNLYDELVGRGQCILEINGSKEIRGIAETDGLLYGSDESTRGAAWNAIQAHWMQNQDSAAAILNALAGWRLEICRKRRAHSGSDENFLSLPLFENRTTESTINSVMEVCRDNRQRIQKAAVLMARALGKEKLDPWDIVASYAYNNPHAQKTFEEAAELVRCAFGKIDFEMGDFVDTMIENQWIEARVLPTKAGGAFCTTFDKSSAPRVFQSYLGSFGDVTTLAHELGHAYHSWVLRDVPYGERRYPSTLAETASVFAEFSLKEEIFDRAQSSEERLEACWPDLESAMGYLINVPARFEFESRFYEKREVSFVSADQLSDLMNQSWENWYGSTLTNNDKMFWARKAHFSIADASFYNFPYTFGYLFSLSLYSIRKELGPKFFPLYRSLLQDTGRMTAEDLVRKYFNLDIREKAFWQRAIDVVIRKIDRFESVLNEFHSSR